MSLLTQNIRGKGKEKGKKKEEKEEEDGLRQSLMELLTSQA